jgi:hypothetical protein
MLLISLLACGPTDPVDATDASNPSEPDPTAPSGLCAADQTVTTPIDCADGSRGESPFECVEYTSACEVRVLVDDVWYDLVSIDGLPIGDLIVAARTGCTGGDEDWRKRIAEDLDRVFDAAGCTLGATVDLQVDDGTGVISLTDVPVTEEKRDATKDCWEALDACP